MRYLPLALCLLTSSTALAQYTPSAGQNAPRRAYEEKVSADGRVQFVPADKPLAKDSHGNASGNQYDLAVDGAFDGQTVLILDQVGNTLVNTRAALAQKGLSTVVYGGGRLPPVADFKKALSKSCEVWLISSNRRMLSDAHIALIKDFFEAGHGVYIWGDNDPLYVDANRLASALVPGLHMQGDLGGDLVVGLAERGSAGVAVGHLITTGLEHLYEGVTIATLLFNEQNEARPKHLYGQKRSKPGRAWDTAIPAGFTPLMYGSAGNLVSVAYERNGRRLVIDGGFTRLAVNWDDAGTARFVKNAAAWLVNSERFKKMVVGSLR